MVKFETVHGESFDAELPIAMSDTILDVETRIRTIGAKVVTPTALGEKRDLASISIQYFDPTSKQMSEVNELTSMDAIKKAGTIRVLILGFQHGHGTLAQDSLSMKSLFSDDATTITSAVGKGVATSTHHF